MMARLGLLACALCCVGVASCDPNQPCDSGYGADHGYCYLLDAGYDWVSDAQNPDGEDSGVPASNPSAMFGMPCILQSDCGGKAPVCGGPMLPICTDINCMEGGTSNCPNGWQCIDVTKYMASAPGVMSVCIMF